ncbi:hypothetical protein P171DRAFT_490644 [Karstenula rhodostoma CBS 690.94]|uniref:Uncharacterized protein n=1 Tax=Karstenula rhodostoma CBS 690.94 TaxID=1392251 RepID=A0A9P4P6D2_9PLEO|nr:hypothetical protein P171DRAFT_490644 [Karstenula rhodostoma CBS 690.94]
MSQTATSELPSSPKDRPTLIKDLQDKINAEERWAQRMFVILDDYEERYREFGMMYHTTSLRARTSSRISPETQQILRTLLTDYSAWREPLVELQEILQKLLWECRPNGTLEALEKRAEATMSLRNQAHLLISRNIWERSRQTWKALFALKDETERLENSGVVTQWYLYDAKADKARGYHLPAVKGPEWEIYRQWVYTLPETRKSMSDAHDPRPLDLLASNILYKAHPSMWDAHWNAPLVQPHVPHPFFSLHDMSALLAAGGESDEDSDEELDAGERALPTLPTDRGVNLPIRSREEVDVLVDILVAPFNVLLGVPRLPVTNHAVTPDHQVVEDGFIH